MDRQGTDWRDVLFARRSLGVRLDVRPVARVIDALRPGVCARPPFSVTQVVGTNGKGSTAAMLAHGLKARGRGPVGLFTSPHLHRVGERVQIDGTAVEDEAIRVGVERVGRAEAQTGERLSFFEVLTAIALDRFVARECRHVVLEAGLGGRLDATTAVRSSLTVVTRIARDHEAILGAGLPAIAAEKAAVIRDGARVLAAAQAPEVEAVLADVARRRGASLTFVRTPVDGAPLVGEHQRANAALALAALRHHVLGAELSDLAGVHWPGRLEAIGSLWFDVAHNLDGTRALVNALRERPDRPEHIVFGCRADKPRAAMTATLRELGPVREVAVDEPIPDGVVAELADLRAGGRVALVCGSHAVVAPLRAWALDVDPARVDDPRLTDPVPR